MSLTLLEVIKLCSSVKLKDGSLTFDSYGSDETRVDTMEFLYENNLTLEDAEEVINNLKPSDYRDGPIKNYDSYKKEKDLWVFKTNAFRKRIYVKLIPYRKDKYIAVVSFHEDR